jgi:hypothetical protein
LARKLFWMQPTELLGNVGHGNLVFVRLEMEVASVQERCTVYAEHTNGSKIVLDAPDGTPR